MTKQSNITSKSTRREYRRVNMLASCIEHLTEHRINEKRALACQANWLAVQIDENSDDLSLVIFLAGMGLDLAQKNLEDDDILPDQLSFLFGEIADQAVATARKDAKPSVRAA